MDDIARDPIVDAQVVPNQASRPRLKGPVAEFAVSETDAETDAETMAESAEELALARAPVLAGQPGQAQPRRLPRVLPLLPSADGDVDDLLDAPRVDPTYEPTQLPGGRSAGPTAASVDPVAEPPGTGPLVDAAGDATPDREQPEDEAPDDAGADEPADADDSSTSPPAAGMPEGELPTLAEPITDPQKLVRVVFGLLLTNRDGLSPLRLAQVCDTSQEAVRTALETLRQDLTAAKAPLELTQSGESFKLWTTPEVFPYLETLRGIKKNERLSPAALETLAVIAYRQPVFRAEIEAIRGVKVGPMLRTLLDCKLVRIVGRADVPGRPLQYGTTQFFLERFGLSALTDLPSVKEFKGLGG